MSHGFRLYVMKTSGLEEILSRIYMVSQLKEFIAG